MTKRLYKSNKNKMIDGVCGGIAEYFNVDPTLVRLAAVLFCVAGGSGLLAYIVAAIIVPRAPEGIEGDTDTTQSTPNDGNGQNT